MQPEWPGTLGPFDISGLVGRGGMGVVLGGVHREEGTRVAIKVMTQVSDAESVAAFRDEVRAVARLAHPNVVAVFEHGETQRHEARGEVPRNAPYLAMELVTEGSVRARAGALAARELLALLDGVLAGLAHAHARGVIHRDIKPGNVLASLDASIVKLADFGLASVGSSRARPVWGTPGFMAPELLASNSREVGPASDLYAVGCLAWALVVGRSPFARSTTDETLRAHLEEDAPALDVVADVSPALARWVARLLRRSPEHRFELAADARAALHAAWRDGSTISSTPSSTERTGIDDGTKTIVLDGVRLDDASVDTSSREEDEDATRAPMLRLAPGEPPHDVRTQGMRVGLLGLRTTRLVARDRERALLWEALRASAETGRARLVVIAGAPGTGKTRLARWLTEAAHETGAARSIVVTHANPPSPRDGLEPMLARALGVQAGDGASPAQVRGLVALRVAALSRRARGSALGALEAEALAEMLSSRGGRERSGARLGAEERFALAGQVLSALASSRPLVVRIENAERSRAASALASYLAKLASPLLVLVTSSVDLGIENAARIELGALGDDAIAELVRQLIDLEGSLAARIVSRANGSPLFAVEMVRDLMARDALERTPAGFALRAGEEADQGTLEEVFERLARRMLEGEPHEVETIAAAVALGARVEIDEWREVLAGDAASIARAAERMLRRGLLRTLPEGRSLAFAHPLLRDAAERALAPERARKLHDRIADILVGRGAEPSRIARHLARAGRDREAARAFLRAADERNTRGDADGAALALDGATASLERLGTPPDAPERALVAIRRARAADTVVRIADMDRETDTALAIARRAGDPDLLAEALLERAKLMRRRGDPELAPALLDEAFATLPAEASPARRAELALHRGWVHYDAGELHAALRCFATGSDLLAGREEDEPVLAGLLLEAHGAVSRSVGDPAAGRARLERALELFERAGYRRGAATVHNWLGDLSRILAEPVRAETHYLACMELGRRLGNSTFEGTQHLNLAVLDLVEGTHRERALSRALTGLAVLLPSGRPAIEGNARLLVASAAAACERWDIFDESLPLAAELLERTRLVDVDTASSAERAALFAEEAGQHARAAAAWELARRQWEGLGRHEDAARAAAARDLRDGTGRR